MRKVLGQPKKADAGPTEQQLRRWLEKDPKGYTEAIDKKVKAESEADGVLAELGKYKSECGRLTVENLGLKDRAAELERQAGEDDPGTDKSLAQIEKLLADAASNVTPDGRCVECGQPVQAKAA